MSNIVSISDFIDPCFIDSSNEYVASRVTSLITSEEKQLISYLFGDKSVKWLYDNKPTEGNTTYNIFYNGGYYLYNGDNIWIEGVKTILVNGLYFYLAQRIDLITTSVGVVSTDARPDKGNNALILDAHNRMVDYLKSLNYYISANPELFESSGISINIVDYVNSFGI